jgi:hypothetical protein
MPTLLDDPPAVRADGAAADRLRTTTAATKVAFTWFGVRIAHDGQGRSSSLVLPVVSPTDLSLPLAPPAHDGVWLQPCRAAD